MSICVCFLFAHACVCMYMGVLCVCKFLFRCVCFVCLPVCGLSTCVNN